MANYEIDVITVNDGDILAINPNDKIFMKSDGTGFVALRWLTQR